ncbi:putative DNA mismatch repair protein (Mlh3) [Aspergillus saccharolyticus JOP 1030-1]|uniref:MutL C-terminal dimerisation domain-containing protein n=1 Tax=Aspergillus saccharolyticus JOP 1030-1 TaxID=1450539 RepID=A0A318ZE62_9EURO|nr:hypothetical protein BP01DRAFT_360049 [Aspergillus saccharolyticus JOP 1030-1]PYH41850.1 hypothetical protein BP01DRAFT_360049 [Aspergillus saccharolyticus JOP 1030-1]
MNSDDPRIQPLPPAVVAKIKSSTTITSLKGVIIDLVKNALDANAQTVYITVDFPRGGCIVEDDGDGIPPFEFDSNGGLGKAHHTSRLCPARYMYGHRGSFLSSLSALSILTITSRHLGHDTTNTLVFHHATPILRLTPAPSYHELRFGSHGTSITVNDLFGNLPVRVKSRALALQKPEEIERQWDDLRQLLVALMLANNQLAKLVVMDASREKKLSLCHRAKCHETESMLELQRINSILYQACLVGNRNHEHWDLVSASVPGFQIQAAISPMPSPTKKVQFVSLGPEPMLPQSNANIVYTEVNRIFALSDFETARGSPSSAAKVEIAPSGDERIANSSSKESTKFPMFYIRIIGQDCTCFASDIQCARESILPIQRILDVLEAMLSEFLRQRGLRPRAARKRRHTLPKECLWPWDHQAGQSSSTCSTEKILYPLVKVPDVRRTPTISHHFANWTRIKSASTISQDLNATRRVPKLSAALYSNPLQRPELSFKTGPGDAIVAQHSVKRTHLEAFHEHDSNNGHSGHLTVRTDPCTGRSHMINCRTGQSTETESSSYPFSRPRSTGSLVGMRKLEDENRPSSAVPQRPRNAWVDNLLDVWENPIFGRPETLIHILDLETSHRTSTLNSTFYLNTFGVSKYRGKLRKDDLNRSHIIAQVDRKFILAAIGPSASKPNTTLVLIDQHAADERCRVEALLASFFSTVSTDITASVRLGDPIVFEIPATEVSLFHRYEKFYSGWGVHYSIKQGPRDARALFIAHALPVLIAERCRTEPELVSQLIREDICRREESRGWGVPRSAVSLRESCPDSRPGISHDAITSCGNSVARRNSWLGRLNNCPQGIIELLNSRACRTAIMFNDVLEVKECQSLVRRLLDCNFPFLCAHGRPSMIPILDINTPPSYHLGLGLDDGQTDEYTYDERCNGGFVDAYKRWQGDV